MADLLEELNRQIESGEFDEYIDKMFREQEIRENVDNRWYKKFHKLTKEERDEIISKIVNKYDSEEYESRWYKRGIEPPSGLKWFLLGYAQKYGKRYFDKDNMFVSDKRILDGKWVIKRLDGQGSFVSVRTIKEERKFVKCLEKWRKEDEEKEYQKIVGTYTEHCNWEPFGQKSNVKFTTNIKDTETYTKDNGTDSSCI